MMVPEGASDFSFSEEPRLGTYLNLGDHQHCSFIQLCAAKNMEDLDCS